MIEIKIKITEFEKGRTVIVEDNNKMWEDDVCTTSSRVRYEVDGCKCGMFVKADNETDALLEIIPKVILNEYLEYDYSFNDLGLSEPKYRCEDGEGTINDVVQFLNLRNENVFLVDEARVVSDLVEVGKDLFEVVVV